MKKFKFEIVAKLADGTEVIFNSDFIIGTEVFVLDEAGNKIVAPDGEHELEDGTKFKTEAGMITEITEKVEEVAPEVEVTVEAEKEEVKTKMITEDEFASLMATIDELKSKIESLKAFEESFELVKEQTLAEIKMSAVKPTVIEKAKSYREIILEKLS